MALANLAALYVLGPGVKRDLDAYWRRQNKARAPG
jgi:hypothetical protein